ncbi:lytic transglycosylase domain-containing protein [Desulfosarcina sp.]|uniref:lytic transglycosylase domain-containing protein n=1 Tax=Desulfosarcina sp. TaxID=2027861 RepID=UPI0029BB071D|nr:transglycosylase SLT domain-containing protein [Desulfosarcina sp.]MDX2455704.1 transglycosylase SLT domain-containing protein [Desulfosarcina sp.]MDX2493177.1 transglycosylase SLT domain-containing protein [Desulfosarcina sp.]
MNMTIKQWPNLVVYAIAVLFSVLSPRMTAAQETADDVLLSALKLEQPILLCGETVPVDYPQAVERFEKEMLVSLGNRPQVILWLKRTTRYFPYIEQMLRENGLPDDLKYLAIAESALRMHAGSPKGAMGVWQLMPQTARKYGLVVDVNFDERRNLYLSTPAALTYLKTLYERFGSWSLSLAAYNMGEEGLEAEILEQGLTNYYQLYLPLETQRFVFRILAIKRIVEAPQNHGFNLSPGDFYAPKTFSTVRVNAFTDLPLRLIANAAKTDFKTIKDFNPEIRGHYLAAGTRAVNIPGDGDAGFEGRLTALIETDTKIRNQRVYVVKEGDSLSSIAQKFEVPLAALLIWNRIGLSKVIHPGQRLVIFPAAGGIKTDLKDIEGDADG